MKLPNTSRATYVDTPNGLFTAAGIWFGATEKDVEQYAGPVLERRSLAWLLGRAEIWLRSPETLALWGLPIFLTLADPVLAAVATVLLYVGWRIFGPSFVLLPAASVLAVLDHVLLQGLYYVFMLSRLLAMEQLVAVVVGLVGFVLLRWGLAAWATEAVVRPLHGRLYRLPVPDQILRAFITRVALRHRLSLPHLDRMERRILENWNRGKS